VLCSEYYDRLCGLVVRVLGYRSRGPGSIPDTTRKKVVGLERGPLSLMSTTEELLSGKVAAPVYKIENMALGIRHADHVAPCFRKRWQSLCRQAEVSRSVEFARGLRPWSLVFFFSLVRNIMRCNSKSAEEADNKCQQAIIRIDDIRLPVSHSFSRVIQRAKHLSHTA
jgi:hypothetical protein